ncbi:D-tyrosyl-tRNA(Tyr) deacylase [Methanoculleus sp. FWC-SCC1]|uniref:D-aminoacyl-tRNA deacylase n=1 Tax=Methanoculleus frigidifontis TaxID=2584085 RepID=A0ABT8M9D1_9EURY|nr:D-aminoacyl-tRNA deacylase [Methanoculleus sp. FWC-SCC1]MDN7024524.1 D-tyrosyl-tRNA(Tyr) deacylase [Methanoculleus sp. FWC-SCC1]
MRIAIVNSRQDPGGVNIRQHLLSLLDGPEDWPLTEQHDLTFLEVDERLIYQDRIDAGLDADLILFISRHSSRHPVPALTVHVTGNYAAAALGGEERMLAPAAPEWMHALLHRCARSAPEGYRVSYEVTHHGPTDLATPSLFVEIGSTEKEWTDPAAGRAVATSILTAQPASTINLIGFGGTHYAVRQTAIALGSRAAFGHIASSNRQVPTLDLAMVRAMAEKSRAVAAYVDRKALSREEERLVDDLLGRAGILTLTESELLDIGDVDWNTYLQIRTLAGEVAPGSRVKIRNLQGAGIPVTVSINHELLEEVVKSDKTALMSKIDQMPVATLSNGRQEVLPTFITYESEEFRLANDLTTLCVKLLLISGNTVATGDHLLIRKTRFDPEKAHRLGVPPGPLFGKLAGGREIEIEGRRITPDMVWAHSVKEIHLPGLERYT